MITDVVTVRSTRTAAEAMLLMDSHNIRALPVVDDSSAFLGVFNIEDLLERLLPATTDLEETRGIDLRLDALVGSTPDLAHHLSKLMSLKVAELMSEDEVGHVHPETSLWEGIRQLVKQHGRPVPVLLPGSRVLAGLISSQSITHELLSLLERERR